MYSKGIGTKPDKIKSMEHYLVAAKCKSCKVAQLKVGKWLLTGKKQINLKKDEEKGAEMLDKLVSEENAKAMIILGRFYCVFVSVYY